MGNKDIICVTLILVLLISIGITVYFTLKALFYKPTDPSDSPETSEANPEQN